MVPLSPAQRRPGLSTTAIPTTAVAVPPTPGRMKCVIVTGLLATGMMVALLAASQLINYGVFDLRYQAFDTDYHSSVFGVASLLAQFAAAAAMVWRGGRVERHRWAWFALAAIVAGLVLVRALTTFNAKTVAAPLAVVFLLACWLTWCDSAVARTLVWAALGLMAISLLLHEVGLDADVLTYSNQSWGYQLTAVAKHGSELAGWMLLGTGIIAGIRIRSLCLLPGTAHSSAPSGPSTSEDGARA